jgi:hypothetical protein
MPPSIHLAGGWPICAEDWRKTGPPRAYPPRPSSHSMKVAAKLALPTSSAAIALVPEAQHAPGRRGATAASGQIQLAAAGKIAGSTHFG